jgi:hypothetical protein
MTTGFLSRLRTAFQHAFRPPATAPGRTEIERRSGGAPSPPSRLTSLDAAPVRADASPRPDTARLRVEIMASGPFEGLRGIRSTVNRLQDNLVGAVRTGAVEIRLTEVRRTCRNVTAWNRSPVDPGAGTTKWECLVEALTDEPKHRTLFAPAFRDSLRNRVNHIVLFGDCFDDGFLYLNRAVRAFRQRGIRVSTFYLGDDFNGRNRYRFLAAGTGGLHLDLSRQRNLAPVLPIVAAFASGDHARLAALPAQTREAKALMAQARRR